MDQPKNKKVIALIIILCIGWFVTFLGRWPWVGINNWGEMFKLGNIIYTAVSLLIVYLVLKVLKIL